MANNFIQSGDVLPLTAPYDVVAGDGFQVGQIFAVAASAVLSGQPVQGQRVGVFSLKKADAQIWGEGALIYWDNSSKNCTTTAAGNLLIGAAAANVGSSALTGAVALHASVRANEAP